MRTRARASPSAITALRGQPASPAPSIETSAEVGRPAGGSRRVPRPLVVIPRLAGYCSVRLGQRRRWRRGSTRSTAETRVAGAPARAPSRERRRRAAAGGSARPPRRPRRAGPSAAASSATVVARERAGIADPSARSPSTSSRAVGVDVDGPGAAVDDAVEGAAAAGAAVPAAALDDPHRAAEAGSDAGRARGAGDADRERAAARIDRDGAGDLRQRGLEDGRDVARQRAASRCRTRRACCRTCAPGAA